MPFSSGRVSGVEQETTMNGGELLTPAEVARLLRVTPKTVTRWHRQGKLPAMRTLGGHRRFRRSDVERAVGLVNTDASSSETPDIP